MCLLIALTGLDEDHPILVASNRDEARARKAAPPGLFVGKRHRILAPRDRLAGGTWIGINDAGMFAGLTNLGGSARRLGTRSRGHLPHLALDTGDVAAAVRAVAEAVRADVFDGFQMLLTDGATSHVLVHESGVLDDQVLPDGPVVLSNEHRVGELVLPGLAAACESGLTVAQRFARLRPLLLDTGERSGHRILKAGGDYGTVSSSLIAVPRGDPRLLVWEFAAGPPDEVGYRDYGNLGRRLVAP